jgi:hypothetical protein
MACPKEAWDANMDSIRLSYLGDQAAQSFTEVVPVSVEEGKQNNLGSLRISRPRPQSLHYRTVVSGSPRNVIWIVRFENSFSPYGPGSMVMRTTGSHESLGCANSAIATDDHSIRYHLSGFSQRLRPLPGRRKAIGTRGARSTRCGSYAAIGNSNALLRSGSVVIVGSLCVDGKENKTFDIEDITHEYLEPRKFLTGKR